MKWKNCRPRKDTIGPLAVDTMIQEHQDAGTLEPISQRTLTILCILRKADIPRLCIWIQSKYQLSTSYMTLRQGHIIINSQSIIPPLCSSLIGDMASDIFLYSNLNTIEHLYIFCTLSNSD